jgi:hypothetical protein
MVWTVGSPHMSAFLYYMNKIKCKVDLVWKNIVISILGTGFKILPCHSCQRIFMKRFFLQRRQQPGEHFLGYLSLPTINSPFYITLPNILTHMSSISQTLWEDKYVLQLTHLTSFWHTKTFVTPELSPSTILLFIVCFNSSSLLD